MIIFQTKGRLGNQLFQFAFAVSLSIERNTLFLFDNIEGEKQHRFIKYFKLHHKNFSWKQKISISYAKHEHLLPKLLRRLILHIAYKFTTDSYIDNIWKQRFAFSEVKNNIVCNGYFQSEIYFEKYRKVIISLFQVKQKYKKRFIEKYKTLLQSDYTVVHVRLGDYKNTGFYDLSPDGDLTLPFNYYNSAITLAQHTNMLKNLVVLSDEIELAKLNFNQVEKALFLSDSEINDLLLIMNASTCIISNSTFAWWGAYLNKKKEKVIAPYQWMGFKKNIVFPPKIFPYSQNWTILNWASDMDFNKKDQET